MFLKGIDFKFSKIVVTPLTTNEAPKKQPSILLMYFKRMCPVKIDDNRNITAQVDIAMPTHIFSISLLWMNCGKKGASCQYAILELNVIYRTILTSFGNLPLSFDLSSFLSEDTNGRINKQSNVNNCFKQKCNSMESGHVSKSKL